MNRTSPLDLDRRMGELFGIRMRTGVLTPTLEGELYDLQNERRRGLLKNLPSAKELRQRRKERLQALKHRWKK
jgi:hypothetical protein